MGTAIDVPKAVDYAARFLLHFLDDKIVPESILESLEHLAGPGAFARGGEPCGSCRVAALPA